MSRKKRAIPEDLRPAFWEFVVEIAVRHALNKKGGAFGGRESLLGLQKCACSQMCMDE